MFSFSADHKARDILNKQQRRSLAIAGLDEIRDLLCAFGIDNPTKSRGLSGRTANQTAIIRDDSNVNSANSAGTGDHLFGVIGLEFVQFATVQKAVKNLSRIVRMSVIGR